MPDAAQASCSDGKMATSVQEFCTSIAWTRGSREAAAQRTRRAADRNENGHENTQRMERAKRTRAKRSTRLMKSSGKRPDVVSLNPPTKVWRSPYPLAYASLTQKH